MASAKKYQVGVMTRKSFVQAIEHLMHTTSISGATLVRMNKHRGKKYELRVRRKPHGLEIDWGLPGTFYCPHGYDNE
jgi:hypothetical protein